MPKSLAKTIVLFWEKTVIYRLMYRSVWSTPDYAKEKIKELSMKKLDKKINKLKKNLKKFTNIHKYFRFIIGILVNSFGLNMLIACLFIEFFFIISITIVLFI